MTTIDQLHDARINIDALNKFLKHTYGYAKVKQFSGQDLPIDLTELNEKLMEAVMISAEIMSSFYRET